MLELYEICVGAVARYEGRVLKYTGDGVMAQFGYPVAHDDDARRAVLAALTIVDAIAARRREWETRFSEPLEVRVGIDTGAVAVGRCGLRAVRSGGACGRPAERRHAGAGVRRSHDRADHRGDAAAASKAGL